MRFDPNAPMWSRTITLATKVAALFGVFDVLIIGIAVIGGRYQSCGRGGGTCDYYLLAITYPLGSAIMGAIFGATYPLFRRRWLALLLGGVAMMPWFALIAVTDVSIRARWTLADTVLVAICSLAIGPFVGNQIWKGRSVRK